MSFPTKSGPEKELTIYRQLPPPYGVFSDNRPSFKVIDALLAPFLGALALHV